ncbi:MAG: hypothetical protein QG621_385 [Patescibacteria group bacterium]|jgi:uncharacterized membrane protein|nr:hypothetical protein [Patescibacteria group bacterium]
MLFLKLYATALTTFLVLDGLWIGLLMSGFYKRQLGFLFADKVSVYAVVAFYLIYAAGLVFVVIEPNVGSSLTKVFMVGLVVGLMAYATYDLTNQATIKNWPFVVTAIDLAWGALVTGVVSVVTVMVARFFS